MTNPTPTSGAADRCQACVDRNDGFYGSYAPQCPAHNDDGTPRDTALAKAQQPALTAQAISVEPARAVSETVNFTDQSTVSPIEKARRYLTHVASKKPNNPYFFDDGYPRESVADDAAAALSVLEQLAASYGQAPAQPTAAGCLQHLTTLQEQAGMYADDFTPQAAQQASAHVLHLVQDAFAEVAMAYPKAFALHKVGLADTAVREALAAPATQQAGATKEHVRLVRVIANKIEDGSLFRSGIYSNKDLARFVRNVADAAAPQFPTAQAAESVPAIQGETNVQLDTDSNPTAPGKQRDMACSLALGQPVGNGQDQAAGHLGAQGDKLLTVAERNIRSFLRSATLKSESDREAALNCVDVLWEAARAPAGSVPAPVLDSLALMKVVMQADEALSGRCTRGTTNWAAAIGKAVQDAVLAARAPADSVMEDAARLLRQILAASQDGDSDTHLSAHFVSRIETITKAGGAA